MWEQVRAIEIVPQMTGLVRQREKELSEQRTLRLMQGCLTSLAALHGCNDFDQAWAMARPLVWEQFEARGRLFAIEVARKLDRVVSVEEAA